MITTSITGQKVAGDDDDRLPLLLRLAKGTVTARAGEELAGILTGVPDDPGLRNHWGVVLERLLVTMGQLSLRFLQYQEYPGRLALMSRRYNPSGHHDEIMHCLHCPDDEVDTGYSKPLKREALARAADSQTDAILYLLSKEVQEEIDTLVTCVETSTLDVERKHAYDRRIEKHEVCSVAEASRDP